MKSKLLRRTSAPVVPEWNANDTKFHAREEDTRNKQQKQLEQPTEAPIGPSIWKSIHTELNKLKPVFMVKPGKPLAYYNLSSLSHSTDPDEKRAWYRVCSLVNQFLTQEYGTNQLNQFKEQEGNIPQVLVSDKAKKAHKRRVQSSLIRKRHR